MTSAKPLDYYDNRLTELEDLVEALRAGKVDTLVTDQDAKRLLVLKDYESDIQKEWRLAELRAVIETLPTAVTLVRPKMSILFANPTFLFVSGRQSPSTLEDWADGLRAPTGFLDELKQHVSRSFKNAQLKKEFEVTFQTHNNQKLHWRIALRQLPVKIAGSVVVMISGVDVTDQKRLITQLTYYKAQMENFLAAAAHDLKAPLITISHNVTFARMSLGETFSTETVDCLNRVQSAAREMLNLLSQVSEVSRAGHDTEPRMVHSTRELVNRAVRQLEGLLMERHADVVIREDLPEIDCQGTKIVEVFANLLSNAIKYTPRGKKPRVEIGCQLGNGQDHVFFVRDNGIGIAKEYLDEVFELFRRVSCEPDTPGQGVGLTIVKRIVELHNGHVWVESELGRGSTFYFTINQRRMESNDGCD